MLVLVILILSSNSVYAGGSSYSWQSLAKDAVLSPGGDSDSSVLTLSVSNYFPDKRTIKLNRLEVICVGSKIVSSAAFYDQLTQNFVPAAKMKNYGNYQLTTYSPGTLIPYKKDAVVSVNFALRKNAPIGSYTHCAINKVKISDANTGEMFFVGPGGYGFKDINDVSTIIVGTEED